MSIFKGAGVAIVTPMKDNLDVNYEKLEELIDFQVKEGTDCIVIAGTTGEGSTLSIEEHLDVTKQQSDLPITEYRSLQEQVLTVQQQRSSFHRRQKKQGQTDF